MNNKKFSREFRQIDNEGAFNEVEGKKIMESIKSRLNYWLEEGRNCVGGFYTKKAFTEKVERFIVHESSETNW